MKRLVELQAPFHPKRTLSVVNERIRLDPNKQHFGIVGHNTSGKTSVLNGIYANCKQQGLNVIRVDFNSHRQAVTQTSTVAQLLGGLQENADIVIRFGLTPIWWRKVRSLSTGEVRKVLLAQAVSKNPDMLLLERPFDGLDLKTRSTFMKLLEEISNPAPKATARPLVQGVKWKARSPITLCISTHRREAELPAQRINTLLHCQRNGSVLAGARADFAVEIKGDAPLDIMLNLAPLRSASEPAADEVLVPVLEVHRLTVFPVIQEGDTALDGKEVQRPLLDRVSWTVHPREVWWVQGDNGSSKSTLLSVAIGPEKMLDRARAQHGKREWEVIKDTDEDRRRKRPPLITCTRDVEMVSTENHISMLETMLAPERDDGARVTVYDMLQQECKFEPDIVVVCQALGLDLDVLNREFTALSFGEQRLVLIALAIVPRPKLLILDEPCHGLDLEHRRRVAAVVDKLCTSDTWDCACIFVTHQEDELPRSVTHKLVLSQGKVVSRGPFFR